jgi:hypothetical protein
MFKVDRTALHHATYALSSIFKAEPEKQKN